MKLLTRPLLILLAAAIAIIGSAIWLRGWETPIRVGDVVIDNAFVDRLKAEGAASTRDPAIRALLDNTYGGPVPVEKLQNGQFTITIHQPKPGMVDVTITEHFENGSSSSTSQYARHKRI